MQYEASLRHALPRLSQTGITKREFHHASTNISSTSYAAVKAVPNDTPALETTEDPRVYSCANVRISVGLQSDQSSAVTQ